MEYKGYSARVEFDSDAGILYGEVEGLRDVITFEATSVKELEKAFRDSVNDYLTMCAERGEEPDKPYSGKFVVRVDPQLHREASAEAARQGKSLNAFAADAMRDRLLRFSKRTPSVSAARFNATASKLDVKHIVQPSSRPSTIGSGRQAKVWDTFSSKTPPLAYKDPATSTPNSSTPTADQAA